MAWLACAGLVPALVAACSAPHGAAQGGYPQAVAAIAQHDYQKADAILTEAVRDGNPDSQVLLLAGKVALEQGDAQRTASLLEELAQRDQGAKVPQFGAQLRPYLAQAQLMLNNLPGALHTLGRDYMADPLSCAVEVRALAAAGEYRQAIDTLDAGLKAFPQASDLLVLDGIRAQALGQSERADAITARLLKSAPDNIDVLTFAGRMALAERRMGDARAIFTHLHDLRPRHPTEMLALASIARDTGDSAAEQQWLDQARRAGASNPVAATLAAELALQAGHADEADRIIAPIDDRGAANANVLLLKGLVNAALDRRDIAVEQLSAYLAHGGDDGRAHLALAVMLVKQGDKARAWRAIKPLADAANATLAPLKLASALATANHDPAAAAGYAARAEALTHEDPRDLAAASAALSAGDWRRADAIYTRLLAGTQGNRVMVLNNAAYARINLGKAAEAVVLARQAAALAPDDPVVMDTLGWALVKSGSAAGEATTLLRRAADLQPGNPTIRQHLMAALSAG